MNHVHSEFDLKWDQTQTDKKKKLMPVCLVHIDDVPT